MKKDDNKTIRQCLFAALCLSGAFAFPSLASTTSEEVFSQEMEAEFGDSMQLGEEDLDFDMDIETFTEQYLQKLEQGEVEFQGLDTEKIEAPPLTLEQTDTGMFRYTLPDGNYYEATVPNGMMTGDSVSLSTSSNVMTVVTKDGESSSLISSLRFSEAGDYQIRMLFYEFEPEDFDEHKMYEVTHSFTIAGKPAGNFGAVTAPEGFQIISVKRNGIPQKIETPACFFLNGDGRFEIRYSDLATETMYAATTFERDTIAPFLTFSEEIGEGKVRGPITFTKTDAEDRVYLFYNGHRAETQLQKLTEAGKYGLEVVDRAGNSRTYHLEIKQTYHLFSAHMLIVTLLFFGSVGGYLLLLKRDGRLL